MTTPSQISHAHFLRIVKVIIHKFIIHLFRVGWGKAPPLSVFTFLDMKYWTKSGDILCSGDICCDLSTPQKQIHCDLNYLRYLQFLFLIFWPSCPMDGARCPWGASCPICRDVLPPYTGAFCPRQLYFHKRV